MKKILFGVLTLTIVLSVSASGVFAAGEPVSDCNFSFLNSEKVCNAAGSACRYVDEDNNGICDFRESSAVGRQGQNYVDADGDGICDNRNSDCQGQQKRNRGGNGCGGRNCR